MARTGAAPQGTRLSEDFLKSFVKDYIEAFNSHEASRLLSLMTSDVVFDDAGWPRTMRGHEEVRVFLESNWRAFPDLRFELIEPPFFSSEGKGAFVWRATGTMRGPMTPPGFAPTGKSVSFEGADTLEFRDDKVCRLRGIFDTTQVARQIGVLPPSGSKAEQLGALLQRLVVRVTRR